MICFSFSLSAYQLRVWATTDILFVCRREKTSARERENVGLGLSLVMLACS